MPELPEVQTIVTDLQAIVDDEIIGFFSDLPKAIKNSSFEKEVVGKKVRSVTRLGKFILIGLSSGKNIGIHLKMTGKLILGDRSSARLPTRQDISHQLLQEKHLHHVFALKKNGQLDFFDVRKFATISLFDTAAIDQIKQGYGIDPVNNSFSLKHLLAITDGRNKTIKEILMDNSFILGIGNIYASEILFDAGILPNRSGNSLSEAEVKKLHHSIKKILTKAIRLRGTSVSDYRDAKGKAGSFQNHLSVYKKNGQKCKKCGTIITRSVIGQRSTFYCSKCQK